MAGILSDVTGAGEALQGVSGIASTVESTLFRLFPNLDKGQAAMAAQAIQTEMLKQQGEQNAGQIQIDTAEAGNPNVFVSGWRPFIGWVLGAGFAWAFVIGPIVAMIVRIWKAEYQLPVLDTASLTSMTLAMLGLGTLHTVDKYNGTTPPSGDVTTTKTIKKALPVK